MRDVPRHPVPYGSAVLTFPNHSIALFADLYGDAAVYAGPWDPALVYCLVASLTGWLIVMTVSVLMGRAWDYAQDVIVFWGRLVATTFAASTDCQAIISGTISVRISGHASRAVTSQATKVPSF